MGLTGGCIEERCSDHARLCNALGPRTWSPRQCREGPKQNPARLAEFHTPMKVFLCSWTHAGGSPTRPICGSRQHGQRCSDRAHLCSASASQTWSPNWHRGEPTQARVHRAAPCDLPIASRRAVVGVVYSPISPAWDSSLPRGRDVAVPEAFLVPPRIRHDRVIGLRFRWRLKRKEPWQRGGIALAPRA